MRQLEARGCSWIFEVRAMDMAAWRRRWIMLCVFIVVLSACTPFIAPFDAIAYQNATSAKVETLSVMAQAQDPIAAHQAQVDQVILDIKKAREYAAHIPSNQTTVAQWDRLTGYLVLQFFDRWKDGPFLPDAIKERQLEAARAFDQIICLETNNREAKACPVQGGGP